MAAGTRFLSLHEQAPQSEADATGHRRLGDTGVLAGREAATSEPGLRGGGPDQGHFYVPSRSSFLPDVRSSVPCSFLPTFGSSGTVTASDARSESQ